MGVIELGEVGRDDLPPEGPRRRPGRRADNRWLTAGGLFALVLATMAGGGPRSGPLPEATIPARLGAQTVAAGDRLFVIDPAERVDPSGMVAEPSIAAYRLPDARPLWRVPLPVARVRGSGAIDSRIVGETLVMTAAATPGVDSGFATAALDVRSGTTLWRRPGHAIGRTPGGLVLLGLSSPRSAPDAAARYAALSPRTGAVRWSLAAGGRVAFDFDDEQVRAMITIAPPNRLAVHDVETGTTVRAVALPGERVDPQLLGVDVAGGLLLLRDDERGTVTAYGLDRLERRWTRPLDASGRSYVSACGDAVCVQDFDEGGLRVLDPRDGRIRWSHAHLMPPIRIGARMLAWNPGSGCRNPWLCRELPDASGVLTVVDPATGKILGELGPWQWTDRPGPRGDLLAVRIDSRTGRAQVARLDPATLTVRTLGMLTGVSAAGGGCGVDGTTLHCRRRDASVGVWRLPA
ncbi:PQQ-like domain-containing protein [Micromonospora pattaloongensis]|uniref:PQQ-like domain-containing protein n=1 Tax=Micromonospora pattaloongensis TaxID=405436 RepID=A0A1H3K5P5_9ACTN|nr:PQQ-binding-like beta-propeller repeat protein [Micromonospora pattaloongensis]SDY46928.1 PQQ-like domain-containing protein [Micromonospora pattaloongensis]